MMYQLCPDASMGAPQCIKRLDDNAFIPFDKANTDYQKYLEWLAEGNEPDPGPSEEQLAAQARSQRDTLLSQSDWTQVPDAPVDQTAWAEYRQALRDVPQQNGFPTDITWPTKPE